MGQQTSRKSGGIYFHQKIPSFLFAKKGGTTQKPQEPIKFQYKKSKKHNKNNRNITTSFGIQKITNLKSVLDGVKSECNGFNICAKKDLKEDKCDAAYKLNPVGSYQNEQREELHKVPLNDQNNAIKNISTKTTTHPTCVVKQFQNGMKKSKKRSKQCTRTEIKTNNLPVRTKSEPNLRGERTRGRIRSRRNERQQFGYEIQDVDAYLTKATLNKPANIPVVLAFPSILYQTRIGGYQAEISLPLGMVVNAIFRNQNWLYVQTPHAEEGYVSYSACLPLGIIPSPDDDKSSPCWEKSTDIFPKPSGNMTDTEKLSCKSENEEDTYCPGIRYRTALSTCGEKSVDRLYLRAAAIAKGEGTRHTLLIINEDYRAIGKDSLSVSKNEVVFLLGATIKGWFYVRNKEGHEGFIPSVIAGHGFL